MREIKFRGKSLANGEWVYGDLHTLCDKPHIHTEQTSFPFAGQRSFIDVNTIGQFTGMVDKNGVEIYEGDVLRIKGKDYDKDFGVVTWHKNGYFFVDDSFGYFREDGRDRIPMGEWLNMVRYKFDASIYVNGNIHDNKELLKKE